MTGTLTRLRAVIRADDEAPPGRWRFPAVPSRLRTVLVVVAPLVLFAGASLWWRDFLVALFVTAAVTVSGYAVWLLAVVLDDRDHWRDDSAREVAGLGRRVTSYALFRRQVDANTADTASLAERVRFLEDLTLGVPGQRDSDRRTS